MILSDISRENKRVAARLLQLDKKEHKNKHFRMLESADITLVAAAGFEPTTFGLWAKYYPYLFNYFFVYFS